jgi:hypothetical protein
MRKPLKTKANRGKNAFGANKTSLTNLISITNMECLLQLPVSPGPSGKINRSRIKETIWRKI